MSKLKPKGWTWKNFFIRTDLNSVRVNLNRETFCCKISLFMPKTTDNCYVTKAVSVGIEKTSCIVAAIFTKTFAKLGLRLNFRHAIPHSPGNFSEIFGQKWANRDFYNCAWHSNCENWITIDSIFANISISIFSLYDNKESNMKLWDFSG